MNANVTREIAALARLDFAGLRQRYADLFGAATTARNRPWLEKRIAWRLQVLAEGDISERARRRAAELANDADLRVVPPVPKAGKPRSERTRTVGPPQVDERLPPAGSTILRAYKGRQLRVEVLATGFRYEGVEYPSLSAVAKAITGSHQNGFLFFKLANGGAK